MVSHVFGIKEVDGGVCSWCKVCDLVYNASGLYVCSCVERYGVWWIIYVVDEGIMKCVCVELKVMPNVCYV